MKLLTTLKQHFGYDSFRGPQREIIERVLAGGDTVVLMPTGGGKSLCYQLPTLLLDGMTVVISPLIALMKDQVQALHGNGIEAAFLNSSLDPAEEADIKSRIRDGRIQLLYVSPERLLAPGFLDYLQSLKVCLFAIDEAHCVSSWGHHFRPDYRKLHIIKETFPQVPVIALTATADRAVRSDIGELLALKDPKMFISSFDRPNLSLSVLPGQRRYEQIEALIDRHPGESGVIYCSSRRQAEQLADKLAKSGVKADHYHAGVAPERRSRVQDDFIHGKTDVICATIAFGMGIDKSDVRFVAHYNMPGNLEGFYQEIGRAGRDGDPAETVLFYSYADVQTHLRFMEEIDNPQYREIQLAKLNRMKEYAEAQVCRRKILLSYFSEPPERDCGNCDVCANPPTYFDGTMLAQMALSAVKRAGERLTVSALVDVLKGTYSPVVTANGFEKLKTFGAGRETTAFAWNQYIQQFLHLGALELDYKDHYTLKLNALSQAILFDNAPVRLVTFETIKARQEQQRELVKKAKTKKAPSGPGDPNLFEHLRGVRREIAQRIGKPAYIVFSDATLQDMAAKAPTTMDAFLEVSGVGTHKAEKYGEAFLSAVADYRNGSTD